MKSVNNYILLVDNYRRPSRQRNIAGRYRVGAKSEKEAIELLRKRIKFGSIQLYYKVNQNSQMEKNSMLAYKEIKKEIGNVYFDAHSATAPCK